MNDTKSPLVAFRHWSKPGRPLADRYWDKVDRRGPDECWPWTGSLHGDGYGLIWNGKDSRKPKCDRAHRVGWSLAGNELPVWPSVIDHKCKLRKCQNVAHMRVVSQKVNTTENSECPHAKNAAKTHCLRGHEFTPENTHRKLIEGVLSRTGKVKQPYWTRVCIACYKLRRPEAKIIFGRRV